MKFYTSREKALESLDIFINKDIEDLRKKLKEYKKEIKPKVHNEITNF